MAFANLTTAAFLRHGMGLRYFLGDENSLQKEQEKISPPPTFSRTRQADRNNKSEPGKLNVRQSTPSPKEAPVSTWKPLPEELWPEQWQTVYSRTKPGVVAWTYLKLARDLSSATNDPTKDERRKLIAKILKSFGSPAGTHTFWPAALTVSEGCPKFNEDVFWSGLKLLGCRALVIMDNDVAKTLMGLSSPGHMQQKIFHGIFVWSIDDIETMIKSPECYKRSIGNLKIAFRNFFPAVFGNLN